MANLSQAKKAVRVSERRRLFNDRRRRAMRAAIKNFTKLITGGDVKTAETELPGTYKAIDKALKMGVIKKNTASRKKSQLAKMVATN